MERQKREEEENMKLQELQQQQENLRRQHEELLQQKEAIERERAEMEKLEQQVWMCLPVMASRFIHGVSISFLQC